MKAYVDEAMRVDRPWLRVGSYMRLQVEDTGTVNTFSICYIRWDMVPLKEPEIPFVLDIDGPTFELAGAGPDRHLERVNGVNITIWTPYVATGDVYGIAIGLPATGARRIDGLAIGLLRDAGEQPRQLAPRDVDLERHAQVEADDGGGEDGEENRRVDEHAGAQDPRRRALHGVGGRVADELGVREQVGDVALLEADPAELHPADLRFGGADRIARRLARDPPRLTQSPELRAEQHPPRRLKLDDPE